MKRSAFVLFCFVSLTVAGLVAIPADATSGNSGSRNDLRVSVGRAPVDPDGDLAGEPTDIVVTFRDLDPAVEGVGLKAGATIRIQLPEGFVDTGDRPVASTGAIPGCAPPLVNGCSTAVILQGWPQSPVPPFPTVTHEAAGNTIVVTADADWFPAGDVAPGPKQVHLMLFGFANPDRPGKYRFNVEIKPDPADSHVLQGSGLLRVRKRSYPSINPNSQANGAPPPFPNSLVQNVAAGDPSLTMAFYLWDRNTNAYVGVDFPAGSSRVRALRDLDGNRIGTVRVRPAGGARNWSLDSGGPSSSATAFVTGAPTGRLAAVLHTDPEATGTYRVHFKMFGGNTVVHTINTH